MSKNSLQVLIESRLEEAFLKKEELLLFRKNRISETVFPLCSAVIYVNNFIFNKTGRTFFNIKELPVEGIEEFIQDLLNDPTNWLDDNSIFNWKFGSDYEHYWVKVVDLSEPDLDLKATIHPLFKESYPQPDINSVDTVINQFLERILRTI